MSFPALAFLVPVFLQASPPVSFEPLPGDRDALDDPDAGRAVPPPALPAASAVAGVPYGFHRDDKGRLMQTSFDLGSRLYLGLAYAPRRRPSGALEMSPAAFDFGIVWDAASDDGRTRHRFGLLEGEARVRPFDVAVTAFRYDMSHRYTDPLLRITTLWGPPERHDLLLDVGMFAQVFRFETAPRGVAGDYDLTLAQFQGTLDLWQSADLRSFVRLRTGPGLELRLGNWSDEARLVTFLPQTILEGQIRLGQRELQQVSFQLRGDLFRPLAGGSQALASDWFASSEVAYEAILLAINDQPVSLRLAAQGGLRDQKVAAADGTLAQNGAPTWEWRTTAGIRMSFFSPPIHRR